MHVEAPGEASRAQSPAGTVEPLCSHRMGRMVWAILIAQVLSIALAVTGVSSAGLTSQGINAPTTQSFLNYCLLAVVFGALHLLVPWMREQLATRQGYELADPAPACPQTLHSKASSSDSPTDAVIQISHPASSSLAGLCTQDVHHMGSKQVPERTTAERLRRLRRTWPVFAAVAFIDVQANTLVTKAYQYTSLTSVTLLDCFTIPCVMILSWLVLHSRYKLGHFLGAFCCIAGLTILVLGDSRDDTQPNGLSGSAWGLGSSAVSANRVPAGIDTGTDISSSISSDSSSSAGSQPLFGDALVLLGALLYSICNVSQELLLGDIEASELLAYIGMFGAVISGLQAAALEHQALLSANWLQLSVAGPMLAFAAAMFCFYTLVPQVLILGGAAVLNISLLTSDVWAALARFLWFGGFQGSSAWFFVASLAMVAAGIVVYAWSGSPKESGARPVGGGDGGDGIGHQGIVGAVLSPRYTRLHSSDAEPDGAERQLPHSLNV